MGCPAVGHGRDDARPARDGAEGNLRVCLRRSASYGESLCELCGCLIVGMGMSPV